MSTELFEISKDESKEEALEIERLQSVERDYADEQRCPCCFTPDCPGVPLNPNPELILQKEEMFKSDVYTRIDTLLQRTASKDVESIAKGPRPGV